jgi:hypothetical protein
MKTIYIIPFILMACGQPPTNVTVDSELKPYFASFERDIGKDTSGVSGAFVDTENQPNKLGETVAECIIYPDGSKTINVDPDYWKNSTEEQRKETIYHELGHAFGLPHYLGYISGSMVNCPISIMNPYTFGYLIDCFTNNEAYYFNELKSHL